jgi:hypothetical protein
MTWYEVLACVAIVVLWQAFRPRPPWGGDGDVWRRKRTRGP